MDHSQIGSAGVTEPNPEISQRSQVHHALKKSLPPRQEEELYLVWTGQVQSQFPSEKSDSVDIEKINQIP